MRRRIDDLVDIQLGYQFRTRLTAASDGTHRVIQVRDIGDNCELMGGGLYRVTPPTDVEKYVVCEGDVLFLSKGRRHSATLVRGLAREIPTIAAGYFFILRPRAEFVLPGYLAWVINAPPAQAYLASRAGGSTLPFVTKQAFADLELDVPPLKRQRSIAELHRLALHERRLYGRLAELKAGLVEKVCTAAASADGELSGRIHVTEAD